MARRVKDARLETRTARERLTPRHEPYWRLISEGRHIGYRKGKVKPGRTPTGKWIARLHTGQGYRKHVVGEADDLRETNGGSVLTFQQAQDRAREWFAKMGGANEESEAGPYTVRQAVEDYMTDYEARSGRGTDRYDSFIEAHILPQLGDSEVAALTLRQVKEWHNQLAATPARLRTRQGEPQRYRDEGDDPDSRRRRRATANRVLTILKAALNAALADDRVRCDGRAWRETKPFKNVDAPRTRYLMDDECTRLLNACPPDLRLLAAAALVTGARYGELRAMKVSDFDPDTGTIHLRETKGGKPRTIYLPDEGGVLFMQATTGKTHSDIIFRRSSGAAWQRGVQYRLTKTACDAAGIKPTIGFHALRHTYGSRLAMRGVPMAVIAAQLGHSDTRMTERHYAHLAPSFIADTVRAAFGKMGVVQEGRVAALRPRKA
jgi:integrase